MGIDICLIFRIFDEVTRVNLYNIDIIFLQIDRFIVISKYKMTLYIHIFTPQYVLNNLNYYNFRNVIWNLNFLWW